MNISRAAIAAAMMIARITATTVPAMTAAGSVGTSHEEGKHSTYNYCLVQIKIIKQYLRKWRVNDGACTIVK